MPLKYYTKANEAGWSMPELSEEEEAAERAERAERKRRAAEEGRRQQAGQEEVRRQESERERASWQSAPQERETPKNPRAGSGRLSEERERGQRGGAGAQADISQAVEGYADTEFQREARALAKKHPEAVEELRSLLKEGIPTQKYGPVPLSQYIAMAVEAGLRKSGGRGGGIPLDPDAVYNYVVLDLFSRVGSKARGSKPRRNVFDRFDPTKGSLATLLKMSIGGAMSDVLNGEVAWVRRGEAAEMQEIPTGEEGEALDIAAAPEEGEMTAEQEARAARGGEKRPWWVPHPDEEKDMEPFFNALQAAGRAKAAQGAGLDAEMLRLIWEGRASGRAPGKDEQAEELGLSRRQVEAGRAILARVWLEMMGDDMTQRSGLRGAQKEEWGFPSMISAFTRRGPSWAVGKREFNHALYQVTRRTPNEAAPDLDMVIANAIKMGLIEEVAIKGARGGARYLPGPNWAAYQKRSGGA